MNIMDDVEIFLPPNSGPKPIVPGRVELVVVYNSKAPLEKNTQTVMLELTGGDKSRAGLDLVAVLDVSGSMKGTKLEQLKKAMHFLMRKLGREDRLSVVKYSTKVKQLCPLQQLLTESSRTELESLINGLQPEYQTNIQGGLEMALDILENRRYSKGRVGAIMLMSDGMENVGKAAEVKVGDVPVHTFGFGDGQDAELLRDIASNGAQGGTYADVRMENLNLAFSLCLAGLLTVVAQDLTVTVTQYDGKSQISQVSAGKYPQSPDTAAGSVTVRFGDLYIKEVRKMLVDLELPAVDKRRAVEFFKASYTYKFNEDPFEANLSMFSVSRVAGLTAEQQQAPAEVRAEVARLHIAEVIKQATNDADNEQLESARAKLVEGMKTLGDDDKEKLKAELRAELQELHDLMKTPEIYDKQGRPFAYSLLRSHETQRAAARGNNIGKSELFSTPAMQQFIKEAETYDNIQQLETYIDEVLGALADLEKTVDKV